MQGWRAGTKWTRFTLARGDRETILTHMRCRRALGVTVQQEQLHGTSLYDIDCAKI